MRRNDALPPMGWGARKLICLLGLPIDVVDMREAVATVREAAQTGRRCFISTPNLNFLMAAQTDMAFRESVLRSDLSLADGVSLLALARVFGVPLPERVSGADLFQELCACEASPPIKVFFFGGPPGAAKLACERVNRESPGVRCVGYDEAGFGDIPSMSSQDLIDRINASDADFVVVSLGAKKGQAWILHNQMRLTAPVICHLGAVVNFTAGTIRRAPRWMQNVGLEWAWRAMSEKGLFKRYWDDGRGLLRLFLKHFLSAAKLQRRIERLLRGKTPQPGMIVRDELAAGVRRLELSGYWGRRNADQLARVLQEHKPPLLEVKAGKVVWLDPYVIGTLAAHHGQLRADGGGGVELKDLSASLKRHIRRVGAGYLLGDRKSNRG